MIRRLAAVVSVDETYGLETWSSSGVFAGSGQPLPEVGVTGTSSWSSWPGQTS